MMKRVEAITLPDDTAVQAAESGTKLDAGLLLSRLEESIITGKNPDKVTELIRKESLWRRLNTADRLRWAELAQMAEDPQTTIRILDSLNRENPSCTAAWQQHLELLSIVGPADAFAGLMARARPHLGELNLAAWRSSSHRYAVPEEKDMAVAAGPFERHHHHTGAMLRFLDLFAGRPDCFARQWADRNTQKQGYVPERRSMGLSDLEDHLGGRKTHGIYLMHTDGNVKTAVIDADLNKDLRGKPLTAGERAVVRREAVHLISRMKELSEKAGAVPLVEFSGGKGYHFWYFFKSPASALRVREALKGLARLIAPDLTVFTLEVFPKQDQPGGKGFGNLVKLPLGIHRATGKRSFFMDCKDRAVAAQLDFLASVQHADLQSMTAAWTAGPVAEVVLHPRWKSWAETYPELHNLRTVCAPLSQCMSLCLEGGTLSLREEKILYQTIGFIADGQKLLHYLLSHLTDFNPHLVDFRLSRLRGTPLGCRKIHSLMAYAGPMCRFDRKADYAHPLLHLKGWGESESPPSEKVTNLSSALGRLQTAIIDVERFLK
ncbi:MAG: CRISPR-associated primase-polymerase type A1 [Pseudomonadota bacterium]